MSTIEVKQNDVPDITKTTVCLKVRLGAFGNSRKVSTTQIEADADKDLLRVSKHLLDSTELKAIKTLDGEIRQWLYNVCLPFDIGIYLLPITVIEKADAKLKEFRETRQALVEIFVGAYPYLCQQAADRLRSLYSFRDYMSQSKVAETFAFEWQYLSFGVPDALKQVSADIWSEERDKAANQMAYAAQEVQAVLRQTMMELVKHMADRLKLGDDGKPMKFKEATVSNLVDFLDTFSFRNVTDDKELQAVVKQTRQLLNGVSAESLRTPGEYRAMMQHDMAGIAAQLDALMVKSGRKFRLEEE